MVRSGTIKTLGLLVAALSVGTFVLLLIESGPARPTVPLSLQALGENAPKAELAFIHKTEVPLQYIKWRNVVVHDRGADGEAVPDHCHFLIGSEEKFGDGAIVRTRLWQLQKQGRHIYVPGHSFDSESIGVCLLHDCRRGAPTRRQLGALIHLVRALQMTCQVPADRVYLHSELGGGDCPGEHFPARAFRSRLLRARR